jgi:hypothetical protein
VCSLAVAGDATFWSQFWPDLVATLFGAFVGIWLALRADHAREQKKRDAQEAALLRAARGSVQANLTLFGQIRPILAAVPPIPSFEMDVGLLDAVVRRLPEVSSDADLVVQLNGFLFQLHHVNRKLDHMLRVSLTGPPSGSISEALAAIKAALTDLANSVMITVEPLERSGRETLLPRIEARIAALEQPAGGFRRLL